MTRRGAVVLLLVAGCGDGGTAGAPSLAAAPRCEVPAAAYELATLSRCPGKIAVDDDYVYWLDDRLMRMPKCGSSSAPEVLLESVSAADLAVDADAVYLADAYDIRRVDTHTLEVTSLAHLNDFVAQQLWVQNGWVYFTTEGVCIVGETGCGTTLKPLIHRVPVRGGATEVVFSYSGGQIFDLVGAGDSLFLTGALFSLPQGIERVDADGGGDMTEILPAGEPGPGGLLATDGAHVYYASSPGIRKVPVQGGASSAVGTETLEVVDLVSDGEYAYWTGRQYPVGGAVRRARRAEATETLAEGHDMTFIAVDRGAVYFGTCALGDDAGIWIVAR
jgi:hypothetical protein